jgi:hypothetical protein
MLDNYEEDKIMLEVLNTKEGNKTVKIGDHNKSLFVHSAYSPTKEADQFIKKETSDSFDEDTHVVFFGFGFGYHIKQFNKEYNNSYTIIEPSMNMLNLLIDHVELDKIFLNKPTHVFVGNKNNLSLIVSSIAKHNSKKIKIVTLSAYQRFYTEEIKTLYDLFKKVITSKRMAVQTNYKFQLNWMENSIKNHQYVLQTPNIIKHIDVSHFKNKPVVIVSAGPSLSEDIELIKYIKDNNLAYVFSVGSAINALISHDILPDAVFSYDPGDKNHLVFEKMIERNLDDIPLVFGSSVGYKLLEIYKGPKLHFVTTQDQTTKYLLGDEIFKNDLITDSPSIAVMAFQITNKLNMGPIIFAGQNLGYLNERRYAEGIDYSHIDSNVGEQELANALLVKDVYGNMIETNPTFNNMRQSLEYYASIYKKEYINTTRGGADIKGIPFQPLEDVVKEKLSLKVSKNKWWYACDAYTKKYHEMRYKELMNELDSFKTIMDEINKINQSIRSEANSKTLEQRFLMLDKNRKTLDKNHFYLEFVIPAIRIEHELMIDKLKKLAKVKDKLKRAKMVNEMYDSYIPRVFLVTNAIETLLKQIPEL